MTSTKCSDQYFYQTWFRSTRGFSNLSMFLVIIYKLVLTFAKMAILNSRAIDFLCYSTFLEFFCT